MLYDILPYFLIAFSLGSLIAMILAVIAGKRLYDIMMELLERDKEAIVTENQVTNKVKRIAYTSIKNTYNKFKTKENHAELKKALLFLKNELKINQTEEF